MTFWRGRVISEYIDAFNEPESFYFLLIKDVYVNIYLINILFKISLIFRQYGSLSTVRLIRPGKEIPLDLRNHIAKHPEIGSLTCAVVEFDKTEECQNAYKSLGKKARDEMTGWEYSLLGSGRNPRRQQKKMKAKERQLLGGPYGYDSSEEFSASPYVRSVLIQFEN